jgi:hypothetical protein
MITLEGWTNVMYNLSDGDSPILSVTFCVLIVFMCSIYLLNIVLAILSDAVTDEDDDERKENREKLKIAKSIERATLQKRKKDPSLYESPKASKSPKSPLTPA